MDSSGAITQECDVGAILMVIELQRDIVPIINIVTQFGYNLIANTAVDAAQPLLRDTIIYVPASDPISDIF